MTTENSFVSFWQGLDRTKRLVLAFAGAASVILIIVLFVWVSREEYAVLFSQLAEGDAAAIVEQLKRQKVPYSLSDGGTTINVPAAKVHETRLSLMASGAALSGNVGFELFDRQGLGATEQSQRVSYQRALQGELARTIGALDKVKQARVHLVLPESSLFRRDRQEPKAAVTLTLHNAAELSREQIMGVQRLVAASVAGLDAGNVIVTNHRGVTLSSTDAVSGGSGVSEARLEMKRGIEDYVTRKVMTLLDRAYGPGQAIVSADVTLNFDQIKRTQQNLLPLQGLSGTTEGGGVLRKREVVSSKGSSRDFDGESDGAVGPTNSSTEIEYEFSRHMEEVIAAPGSVARISIGVIVPGAPDAQKQQRITELVSMAAGIDNRRGDAISIQSLDSVGGVQDNENSPAEPLPVPASDAAVAEAAQVSAPRSLSGPIGLGIAGALLLLAILWRWSKAHNLKSAVTPALSSDDRERLLADMRNALEDSTLASVSRARS